MGAMRSGQEKSGALGRIRTPDRPLRRRLLYPAELPGLSRPTVADRRHEETRTRADHARGGQKTRFCAGIGHMHPPSAANPPRLRGVKVPSPHNLLISFAARRIGRLCAASGSQGRSVLGGKFECKVVVHLASRSAGGESIVDGRESPSSSSRFFSVSSSQLRSPLR